MHSIEDLDGVTVARATVQDGQCSLTLVAASGFTEGGAYFPAESLSINSAGGVAILRDLCQAMLDAYQNQGEVSE